jgi:hypothetical protein
MQKSDCKLYLQIENKISLILIKNKFLNNLKVHKLKTI